MHISDGILDPKICIAGFAITAIAIGVTLKKTDKNSISKIPVISALFFIASLIPFPIGATSVHLTLIGLIGITLGPFSVLAVAVALFFQAILFGHGGITTIGVNTVIFSFPAIIIGLAFKAVSKKSKIFLSIYGGLLSALGIILASIIVLLILWFSASEFKTLALFFSLAQGSLSIIEGMLSGLIIFQILKTKPDIIFPHEH